MGAQTCLLVGTMKGLWIFRSDAKRQKFTSEGPYFPGREVYSAGLDRNKERMFAGISSLHFGAVLCRSDDLGKTWDEPEEANVKFPPGVESKLKRIWQIASYGDTVYAGVEPAALFSSSDGAESFTLNRGLFDHAHRPQWQPGGGGLCLHTIQADPRDSSRLHVAISTGGVYRSGDGGATWGTAHKGVRADFLPDKQPEFGQCVHKISVCPEMPDRIYLQNHFGLYRTDDAGETWTDIANGVPSDFGFPIVTHPRNPDTAYIIPLESDVFRCTPEGKCRVYVTTDAGASWGALSDGLPQKDAYVTVLRDGFDADSLDPLGLYFGTRQGELYASADEGRSWGLIAERLPPIVCVKAWEFE